MLKEIFSMVAQWVLTRLAISVSRLLYSDKKVIDRVRFGLKGGSVSISPNPPVVRMVIEIRNSLASPIELHSIYGDVETDGYTLINNFTKILAETLEKHSDKPDCAIILDLPYAKAGIVRNHIANKMLLSLKGKLSFNAIGRELTKPVELSMHVDLDGLHGDG